MILEGQKHEVTFLCPSPDGVHIAVGYEDGAVRIFSLLNGESNVSFNGHKSAVSVICYDGLGARLVTGSKVSREDILGLHGSLTETLCLDTPNTVAILGHRRHRVGRHQRMWTVQAERP